MNSVSRKDNACKMHCKASATETHIATNFVLCSKVHAKYIKDLQF